MSKTIKIKYHMYDIFEDILESSLSLDFVAFNLETVFKNADRKAVYYSCPAWAHKAKRTYVVRSPVDISLRIIFAEDGSNEARIETPNLDQVKFDRWITPTFDVDGWCRKEKVTLQFNIPKCLFWTNEKNICIEQSPYPLTAVRNNKVSLHGWYNLSSWTRGVSFAMDVVDYRKPIVIKRGDPLYQISFFSENLDDEYKLVKEEPSVDLLRQVRKRVRAKNYIGRSVHEEQMFKKQTSKCPFDFLWKKEEDF